MKTIQGPRVFEGLEGCQRSLDEDYASSATDFTKAMRVAHDPPPPPPLAGAGERKDEEEPKDGLLTCAR